MGVCGNQVSKCSGKCPSPELRGSRCCLIKPDITQRCPVERATHLNQSPSRSWKCAVNGRNPDRPPAHLFRRIEIFETSDCRIRLALRPIFSGVRTNTRLCHPIRTAGMRRGFCVCLVVGVRVPGLEAERRRTHRIWLWSDADGSSGPLRRGFTAQTSRTHSLFPSCISGGVAFFETMSEDVTRYRHRRQGNQGVHKTTRFKMETFNMINHACFSNNGIDLDSSPFLCGGPGFWKVLQKQSDFLWTGQYSSAKWHSNKPGERRIMYFPFSHLNSLRTCKDVCSENTEVECAAKTTAFASHCVRFLIWFSM